MAKYLFTGRYNTEGAKGLIADGGSGRRQAVEALAASVGGSVEAMYYALGKDDVFVIVDLPDHQAATAVALTVAATGAVNIRTTPLLTAAEVDEAVKRSPEYSPPGA
ncbi:MAG: GYD domain-containing protein [Acidimicrobiales bacterium]